MEFQTSFKAKGHENILATHKTTLMITRDDQLTKRGDCIVAVEAERGFKDLPSKLKEMLKNDNANVKITLKAQNYKFEVEGKGTSQLTLRHCNDMVIRKSSYVCERTLMIKADKAASDLPREFVEIIRDSNQLIKITINVIL